MRADGVEKPKRQPRAPGLAALLVALLALLAPRPARADYPLSDSTIEGLIGNFADRVAGETTSDGTHIDRATALLFVRMKTRDQALVDVDAACPIIGKVSNLTAQPLFNVAVTVGESRSQALPGTETTVHLAYLPPKTQVRVSIECKMSQIGYGTYATTSYISGDGFAPGSPLTREGVAQMIAQRADTTVYAGDFKEASSATGAVADQILATVIDNATFLEVAAAFLQVEAGGSTVGRYAVSHPQHAIAAGLSKLFARATPAAATAALEAMVEADVDMTSGLVTPLLDRLCSAGQPERDRAALWTRALSGKLGTSPEARALVVKRCAGSATQTKARLRAASSSELAAALDGLDGPLFDTALEIADGSLTRWDAIAGLLHATSDAKKLATVTRRYPLADITTPGPIRDLVRAVADAEPGPLDSEKATFVGSGLDRLQALAPQDAATLLGELVGLVAQGKIKIVPIQSAIQSRSSLAPEAAKNALATVVRDEAYVLDPAWVLAQIDKKTLDPTTFLAFNRQRLGHCTDSANTLASCLSALPPAVPGLSREAFLSRFVDDATRLATHYEDPSRVVEMAKGLRAVGFDTAPLVAHLCTEAAKPSVSIYATPKARERLLEAAATIDADAACIGDVRSKLRWQAVAATGWTGLRFLFLLVPIALGVVYLRRTYGPVREKLHADNREVAETRAAGGGERRFDPGGWSQVMTAGLAHVGKTLEDESSQELRTAAKLLRDIPTEARADILKKARLAADETLRSGDVRSLLVKLPHALVYVVCFAGRAEQLQTVRRHAAFRDGWEAHAARLREATAADFPGLPLLGWLFFLHADAVTGTLLVALEGDGVSVVPERLLGEREARSRAGRINRHHHEFELTSAPTALPAVGEPATAQG